MHDLWARMARKFPDTSCEDAFCQKIMKTNSKHTEHEASAAQIIPVVQRKQTRTNSRQKRAQTIKMNHMQIVHKHSIGKLSAGIVSKKYK